MRVFSPRSPQPAVWWPGVSSPVSQSRLIISLMISRAQPGLFIIWGRPKYITMMRWRPGARPRLVWGRAWLRGGDQGLSSELGSVSVAAQETDITTHIACVTRDQWHVSDPSVTWGTCQHVTEGQCVRQAQPGQAASEVSWRGCVRGSHQGEWRGRDHEHAEARQCRDRPGPNQHVRDDGPASGERPIRGQCSGHVISLSKSEDSNWDAGLWSRQTNWSVTETGASQHITISDHRPHFQLLTNGLNFHGKIDDLLKPSSNKCESLQNFWLLFT